MGGSRFGFDRFCSRLCEKMISYWIGLRRIGKYHYLIFMWLCMLFGIWPKRSSFLSKRFMFCILMQSWIFCFQLGTLGWKLVGTASVVLQKVDKTSKLSWYFSRSSPGNANTSKIEKTCTNLPDQVGEKFSTGNVHFVLFPPGEVKPALMIRWENQVVQLLESILCIFKVLGQSGMKLLKEKLWREIWLKKKVVFFQIIALEKDKNRQNVKIWRDPVPRSGLAGGVRK